MLTYHLAPEDLSRKLWAPDITVRDALSSFLDECYSNDMFCVDFLNDHAIIPICDLCDDRGDAVLTHLLNGKCVSASPTPSCKLFAHGASSTTHSSHLLCTLLLDAYQNKTIALPASHRLAISLNLSICRCTSSTAY